MTDIFQASAPSGTNTAKRRWDNTETPRQVVEFSFMVDRAGKTINNLVDARTLGIVIDLNQRLGSESCPGVRQPRRSKLSEWDLPASQVGILRFVSGDEEHSIMPPRVGPFFVSSTQEQADAIFDAPSVDLSARLGQALPVIAPMAQDEDVLLAKVVEWLLGNSIVIAPQRVPSSTSTQAHRRHDCFRSKLIATLLDEPIEDGVTHPAESLIDKALLTDSSDCQNWLSQALVEHYPTHPSLCASLVRCIGRLDYDRVRGWGMRVVDHALRNRDAEVREAAIRALEAWGGPAALDMLRRHEDTETWLNEYVQQVIVDLSGTSS